MKTYFHYRYGVIEDTPKNKELIAKLFGNDNDKKEPAQPIRSNVKRVKVKKSTK